MSQYETAHSKICSRTLSLSDTNPLPNVTLELQYSSRFSASEPYADEGARSVHLHSFRKIANTFSATHSACHLNLLYMVNSN